MKNAFIAYRDWHGNYHHVAVHIKSLDSVIFALLHAMQSFSVAVDDRVLGLADSAITNLVNHKNYTWTPMLMVEALNVEAA